LKTLGLKKIIGATVPNLLSYHPYKLHGISAILVTKTRMRIKIIHFTLLYQN